MTGPLVMTAVVASAASWRWGYALLAATLAALSAGFAATIGLWRVTDRARPPRRA